MIDSLQVLIEILAVSKWGGVTLHLVKDMQHLRRWHILVSEVCRVSLLSRSIRLTNDLLREECLAILLRSILVLTVAKKHLVLFVCLLTCCSLLRFNSD